MDVTKLFEVSDDKLEPLALSKLDAMIEQAIAHPQIKRAANENQPWIRRAMAVAAAIIIAVTVSFQFMPDTLTGTNTSISSGGDAFDEVSDLLILETMNDLS